MAKTRQQIIAEAARRNGIPADVLWGIYGKETSFGTDVSTSSAGAKGSFQFIEGTAHSYDYPYTNATDVATFSKQANAAGKYISDLVRQSGTSGAPAYEYAISHYSGGGYGYGDVLNKAREATPQRKNAVFGLPGTPDIIPGEGAVLNPLGNAIQEGLHGNVPNPLAPVEGAVEGFESIKEIFEALLDPNTWLRFAEMIGGVLLIYTGLKALTSGSRTARTVIGQGRDGRVITVAAARRIGKLGAAAVAV